jgi:hypothetical protein
MEMCGVAAGGPVVQALPKISCKDRQLDAGLEFLSFQMGQQR